MKYFETKKDSLEEAISKAINEKPEQLTEARYEIEFDTSSISPFHMPSSRDGKLPASFADAIASRLKRQGIKAKVRLGSKPLGLEFDTSVPRSKMLKVLSTSAATGEKGGGYVVEGYDVNAKDLLEAGGKYLKYSDLLLQKGRLMAKGKNTAMIDKEISKEMKKLNIKEGSDEYEKFFQSALKKFKVDSPADFKTADKKKEFFNYIDKNYKAKEEDLDKEDETSVKKVIKGLKKAVDAHSGQVKSLTKDIQDETDKNVDETLDKIKEANDSKRRNMRSILADIWNMNEGKNPFEKEEGFSSDAQRKAAFASGYKAKGKKGKKEEIEKSSKTVTGKKPTAVEIEPEVK